jgi:hypothetical protein
VDRTVLTREGGWLSITASEGQAVVTVDGEEVGLVRGPLEWPAGPHRIRVERGGFLPAERDVDVPLGKTQNVSVVFEPTPETRAQFVAGASSRRIWSWATIGVGAAATAGGIILAVVDQNALPNRRNQLATVEANAVRHSNLPCDPAMAMTDAQLASCANQLTNAQNKVNNLETGRTVGWIGAGAGAAVLVTGVVLLLTSENPHKYDEKPAAPAPALGAWSVTPSVGLGWATLAASAQF